MSPTDSVAAPLDETRRRAMLELLETFETNVRRDIARLLARTYGPGATPPPAFHHLGNYPTPPPSQLDGAASDSVPDPYFGQVPRPHGDESKTARMARLREDSDDITREPTREYDLLVLLGRGGVGEIWRARQNSLRRDIAVKRLRIFPPGDSGLTETELEQLGRAAFLQEALIAGSLAHPNIIPVYDLGTDDDGAPLLAMKLVDGRVWAQVMVESRGQPNALHKNLDVLLQVCNAVAFAHSRHIVHRDLKPAQVMLGEYGEVLLMDWGLATDARDPEDLADGEKSVAPLRRDACSPAGTPVYMAREQTGESALNVNETTDVYLLGGILYEIITGFPPHAAKTVEEAMALAERGNVMAPVERIAWWNALVAAGRAADAPGQPANDAMALPVPPTELAKIAMRALSKRQEDRFGSVRAFADAIDGYLQGESRREESRRLTQQAYEDHDHALEGEYLELARIDANLTRALVLWPDNVTAATLRQRVLREYAASALGAGDLRLAELLGLHFDSEKDLRDLREQISLADRQRRRAEGEQRIRRIAIGVVAALLIVTGWIGFTWVSTLLRSQQRQRELNQRAADGMIEFLGRSLDTPLGGGARSRADMVAEAIAIYDELKETLPDSPDLLASRARAYISVFDSFRALGQPRQATRWLFQARDAMNRATAAHPSDDNKRVLVDILLRESMWRVDSGEIDTARPQLDQAKTLLEGLGANLPSADEKVLELKRQALLAEGVWWLNQRVMDRAMPLFVESVELGRRVNEQTGGLVGRGLLQSLERLGTAYELGNDMQTAGGVFDEMVSIAQRRHDLFIEDPAMNRDLAMAYEARAGYHENRGDFAPARVDMGRAMEQRRLLAERFTTDSQTGWDLIGALKTGARIEVKSGDLTAAMRMLDDANEQLAALDQHAIGSDNAQRLAGEVQHARAVVFSRMGEFSAASRAIDEAQKQLEAALAQRPDDPGLFRMMADTLATRGRLAALAGDVDQATACWWRWGELEPKYLASSPARTTMEQNLIEAHLAFAAMFHELPLATRRLHQTPILQRATDTIRHHRDTGGHSDLEDTRLKDLVFNLELTISLLNKGQDPDDTVPANSWWPDGLILAGQRAGAGNPAMPPPEQP